MSDAAATQPGEAQATAHPGVLATKLFVPRPLEGFIARRRDVGVLICMNPETAHEDVRTVAPGAAVIYEESLKLNALRNDVHFYPVPFQKLVLELVHDGKLTLASSEILLKLGELSFELLSLLLELLDPGVELTISVPPLV